MQQFVISEEIRNAAMNMLSLLEMKYKKELSDLNTSQGFVSMSQAEDAAFIKSRLSVVKSAIAGLHSAEKISI